MAAHVTTKYYTERIHKTKCIREPYLTQSSHAYRPSQQRVHNIGTTSLDAGLRLLSFMVTIPIRVDGVLTRCAIHHVSVERGEIVHSLGFAVQFALDIVCNKRSQNQSEFNRTMCPKLHKITHLLRRPPSCIVCHRTCGCCSCCTEFGENPRPDLDSSARCKCDAVFGHRCTENSVSVVPPLPGCRLSFVA